MVFFHKGELKVLWPFYLEEILSYILFFAPVFFVPYFIGVGFSFFQYGLIFSVFLIVSLLFEIPTGVVADLHSRKLSVFVGWAIQGIACLLLFFFKDFYAVLVIFGLFGLGSSFYSGAKEAWVIDLLKKRNKKLLNVYFFREKTFQYVGIVISGILGAFIVRIYGLSIIWLLAAASFFLSLIILSFAEEYFVKRKTNQSSFIDAFKQAKISFNYSKKHKVLSYLILAGIFIVLAGNFFGPVVWVPLLSFYGLPDYAFGYLFAAIGVLGVIAPFVGKRIYSPGKERNFIIGCLVVCSLFCFMVFGVAGLVSAFIVILGCEFFAHLRDPVQRIYFHNQIPSELRATIGSVEGMVLSLAGALAVPLAGLGVDNIGPKYTLIISGILIIPAILFYLRIKK